MRQTLFRTAAVAVLTLACNAVFALGNSVVTDFGTVSLDFTQGFSNAYPTNSPNPTATITTSAGPLSFNFYDDFLFTLPATGGTFSAAAVTINLANLLSIDNFQARIYNTAGGLTTGVPTPGVLAQAWSTPFSAGPLNGTAAVFSAPVPLQPSTQYALEVRGLVTGLTGGSYGGNLNISAQAVSAVPEPQTGAMLLGGLMAVAMMMRRRSGR